MQNSPIKLKQSVLAVSAILGLLATHQVLATSTIISSSTGMFANSIGNTYDLVSISNAGTLTGMNYGVNNRGTILTLTNNGSISGVYALYGYNGSIGTLTNYGIFSGSDTGFYNDSQHTISNLINYGTIDGQYVGIHNITGEITSLSNLGLISGGTTAIYNDNATISSLYNSGTISAGEYGIYNNTAYIGTLTNDGHIVNSPYGIYNYTGTIATLTNAGTISNATYGIYNDVSGTISTLSNSGSIGATTVGIYNYSATIDGLSNSGTISANSAITNTDGIIGNLSNSGSITGIGNGIYNDGSTSTIHTLTNTSTGIISAQQNAINNSGSIGTLSNDGIISGNVGIANASGTIGSLSNSGTISGQNFAINNNGGSIGAISNTGIIRGDIYSSTGLSITGGTGSTIGSLTGYTAGNTPTIGSIEINSGNLSFIGGNLLLNDNVTLTSGTLNNTSSALYLANSVTITGNYNQSAAASLNSYVTGSSSYGQLVVNGTANIASGSSINLINQNYAFADGQRYVVVKATTANYNASSLVYTASGFSGTVTGSSATDSTNSSYTDLILSLTGTSVGTNNSSTSTSNSNVAGRAQATTSNAISSLNGLQRYPSTSNAALLNLYDASLAISSTAEGNKAGEQLSPNQNASASYATSSATFDMLNVIGSHLGTLGSFRVAQSASGSGISTGEAVPSQAVWGQVFGGHAAQDMSNDISGYRANYSGTVIGYDRDVADGWRAGGAVSYTYTNVDGTDNVQGSNSHVSSVGLTAYASYVAPKWYANMYATASGQRYSTQRTVSFTGYNGVANGKFNGQQYALKAEFGYPLALANNLTLTPLANLSYSYLHQDGYTESGGNGSALQVNGTHSDAIKSGLGARLDTALQTSWGDVVPYAQLLWNHQYNDNRMAITAAYAGDVSNTSFTSLGSSPVRNLASLTLGATLLRSNNTSLTAYYDLTGAAHYTNQSVSLRFKQAF